MEALIALRAVACNYHEVLVPHWGRLLSLADHYSQTPAGLTGIPTIFQLRTPAKKVHYSEDVCSTPIHRALEPVAMLHLGRKHMLTSKFIISFKNPH